MDSITATSAKIMQGNLSERVPVTRRNDEFDSLAGNLNEMLDRIEQLMQGLKDVTDNVAHDLKTPLTRLRSRAEAATREDADVEIMRTALQATITESDQLIRIFNALLMIARVEAGAPASAFSDLDLSEVAADVVELYVPVAEDKGFELKAHIEPEVRLHTNRALISQALINLVENAIKYAGGPKENGPIEVTLSRTGTSVCLCVSDKGPGIPDRDRERVLDRFVRLEKSRTEPGSGLGLSLASAVAHLHKGRLNLTNNNPGLRACIELPVLPTQVT